MRKFKTEERLQRIISTANSRQISLHVVMENIHDPHNVSAIFRTCDAVGVPKISLLYTIESFPKISKTSSSSANKWIEVEKFKQPSECYERLRTEGFKIYASMLNRNAKNLYEIDFTGKVALVFGNEKRGVSPQTEKSADETFYIPMRGMIQSLNVSVAAAVTLYEAQRQRSIKDMYSRSELPPEELDALIDKWCNK
ncbi:MAG: RNA methyltransferase [Ignavibacteriae bacterium HGW-Ignavibacteriae-3]|nr:MAG: RNA methyltransferase [Ignavibacteriae bacterium HGW-Ignavibacteriae-3]